MRITSWLKNWSAAAARRRGSSALRNRIVPAAVEKLESRALMTVGIFVVAGPGLNISMEADDAISISSVGGQIVVSTGTTGGTLTPTAFLGPVNSNSIQTIDITGGEGKNDINLGNVLSADFTLLTSIVVDAGNGDDSLTGSPDINDSLIGGDGEDTIRGQGGDDTIIGGDGDDSIFGGAGNDDISAGDGDDSVLGEDGADTISAGNGQDTVRGGDGNDSIMGFNGQDQLFGEVGNDTLNGDGGTDIVDGGDDQDVIFGGELNDNLLGGNGNDVINGQGGDDDIQGEAGTDIIQGGGGNDLINGGLDNDTIIGNLGDDNILGGEGDDSLQGGVGDDSIDGGFGSDRILGYSGNDTLTGGGDADYLDGGDGNDSLASTDVVVGSTLPGLSISDATVTEGDDLFPLLYGAPVDVAVTDDNRYLVSADFDNDGDIDLATAVSILLNNGTGGFAPAVATGSTGQGRMDAGDLDGDGDIDIAIAGNSTGDVDLLINNGDGTFQAPRTATNLGTVFPSSAVTIGDFNGDGTLDLAAVIGFANSEVYVTFNSGNATFQSLRLFAAGTDGSSDIVAGDFDGDGDVDLAVAKNFLQANVVYLQNNGSGSFANGVLTGVNTPPSSIVAADFDNDGDLDLATGGNGDTVLLNGGSGTFTASTPIANTGFFRSANDIAAADLDRDGDIDLATVAFSGQISLLQNDGSGSFVAAGPVGLTTNQGFGEAIVLADLTGDGSPEIAVNDGFAQNNVSVFANSGAVAPIATFTVTLSAPSTVPVTVAYASTNGSAVANQDFQSVNNVLTFAPGITSRTFFVTIESNTVPEPTENFFVNLSAPTNAVLSDAQGQGLILDNDGGPTGPTMDITSIAVVEGDSGPLNALVTVTLSAPVPVPITVQYNSTDGTANAGLDYTAVSGTLTFPAGIVTQTITIPISGDLRNEGNEAFFIDLSNPTLVPMLNSRAIVTITDNDGALPIAGLEDTLLGGAGDDTITGASGDDILNGQSGNDSILGGDGNDTLFGGIGDDTLDGQAGDDTLDGQGGADLLLGGDGDDTFEMALVAGGQDTIDGGEGLNGINANGTNNAETINVDVSNGLIRVVRVNATITAAVDIQNVTVNALGGNDLVKIGSLSGASATVLAVNGGEGDDTITATGSEIGRVRVLLNGNNGSDMIRGSLGNDTIIGGAGNDDLQGSDGNDTINAGEGDDYVDGETGNDVLDGTNGADSLRGSAGNDSMIGGNDFDTLDGGTGNDTIDGGNSVDRLIGRAGDDLLSGGLGADTLIGGDGNDELDGGFNDDSILGGLGDDKIRGDHGDDTIEGGEGNDTINGGDGDDVITGDSGNDAIDGGDGNDAVNGMAGNDTIVGGNGSDTLKGGSGRDLILGEDGDDSIDGQGGTDTVAGNQGADTIGDSPAEIDETFVLPVSLRTILNAL